MFMTHKIQEAVFARLVADDRLAARLTGIYDEPPSRARYPYLTMAATRTDDAALKDRAGLTLTFELNLWSDEPSQMESKDLMADVSACLNGFRPQFPDLDVGQLLLKSASVARQSATSGSLYLGKLSFQVQVFAVV